MRSAYLVRPGEIELRCAPIPDPGEGEILVKVAASLTCGTDLKAYLRGHGLIPMPGPFGHEFSGTVCGIGKGVTKFAEADAIMSTHSAPCLSCSFCRRGIFNLCSAIMKTKVLGAFADFILLPKHVVEQNTFLKPADLPFDAAAMLEPLSCVVHPYSGSDLYSVATALVIGAGPIGLLHLLFLRAHGISTIVSDLNEQRLRTADGLGASVSCPPGALEAAVTEMTHGEGVDMVVECTGMPEVWEHSVRFCRRGGTVVLFGGCPSGSHATFDTGRLHYDEITLRGSFHYDPRDVLLARQMLVERRINVAPLISGAVNLEDIALAFENLRAGRGIKYAIIP